MSFDTNFPLITLKEVAKFINGDRSTNYPKGADYIPDGIPFISAADLGDEGVDQHKVKRITAAAYERLRSGKIQHRDILFCLRGSIGKMAFVKPNEIGAIASSLVIVRANPRIDSRYLNFLLCSQAGQQAAMSLNNGSAQPNLSVSQLQQVRVPLPTINEQLEIAATLGALDDRITLLRETNATLEAIAQALFKSWFVDFDPVRAKLKGLTPEGMIDATARLFPDSFEESELGLVPTGWRVGALTEISKISSGNRPNVRSDVMTDATPIPLFGGAGIMGFTNESLFQVRKILTGRVGTLGKVHIAYPPFWASDNVLVLSPETGRNFLYCFHWLKSIDVHSLNRGSTQPLLTQKDLGKQQHVIPTEPVLSTFAGIAEIIYEAIRQNADEAQTLATMRDTLLPRLISGQLRLPEAQVADEESLA